MAFDCFLCLDAIKGESKDHVHTDQIDIITWSWGMTQSGSMGVSGGGGVGKVNIQDLSITKYVDKSSTNLMQYCASGKPCPTGELIVRKAGGDALEYLKIEMTDVIITSVSTGGSGDDENLTETVTLNFAKVKTTYTPQDAIGTGAGDVLFNWNVETNSET